MGFPAVSSAVHETACSSSIGGVVTSGGGFSDVYMRDHYAPWQVRPSSSSSSSSGSRDHGNGGSGSGRHG